jgi:hypothetical protein
MDREWDPSHQQQSPCRPARLLLSKVQVKQPNKDGGCWGLGIMPVNTKVDTLLTYIRRMSPESGRHDAEGEKRKIGRARH